MRVEETTAAERLLELEVRGRTIVEMATWAERNGEPRLAARLRECAADLRRMFKMEKDVVATEQRAVFAAAREKRPA